MKRGAMLDVWRVWFWWNEEDNSIHVPVKSGTPDSLGGRCTRQVAIDYVALMFPSSKVTAVELSNYTVDPETGNLLGSYPEEDHFRESNSLKLYNPDHE